MATHEKDTSRAFSSHSENGRTVIVTYVDATDMGLKSGEIRRIEPDDIAEMFMMTTQNMALNYLVDQVRRDVG